MSHSVFPITAVLMACCFGSAAFAGERIAAADSQSRINTLWSQPCATGEWGGLRTKLSDAGIELSGSYASATLGVVSGGLKRGVVYNGWLTLNADASLEKLINWKGATLHVSAVDTHGPSTSQRYVGDFGTLSGFDSYDSFRLYEAWLQQNLWDDKLSIRAGLMAFEQEFFVTDRSAFFLASGFTSPVALWSNMPFPTAPDSVLGLRVKLQPTPDFYVMAVVFDGNPSTGNYADPTPGAAYSNELNRHNTHLALRSDEGALCIAEIGWSMNQPEPAKEGDGKQAKATVLQRGLAGQYKLGLVYHSDTFADVYDTTLSNLGSSLAPDHIRNGGRNYAIYASVDQELWREPGTDGEGLGAFFRGVWLPNNRNFVEYQLTGGLTYKGLVPNRADDTLGLGVVYYSISDQAVAAVHNTNKADHLSVARPDFEAGFELAYCCQLTPWLSVQPELQYIIHPGGTGETDNALVVGLVTNIVF